MRVAKLSARRRARVSGEEMAEEGVALFETAVSVVLRGWPALQMAVSHQFGGPQSQAKATWMEEATAQWMRENGECPWTNGVLLTPASSVASCVYRGRTA